ncbi:MAG: hypothetical protein KGZ82_04390 [Bacteroidales bacterium]|nr:hypothetical protein [Bacteroidales bacterium]
MKTWLFILILIAAAIILVPFVLYGFALINEEMKLRAWRKDIARGMSVIVDNGHRVFIAKVVGQHYGSIRVIGEDGLFGAYGEKCIFPLNYYVIEDENNIQNENTTQEK